MKIYDRLTEGLDPAKAFEFSKLIEMYNSGQKELEESLLKQI